MLHSVWRRRLGRRVRLDGLVVLLNAVQLAAAAPWLEEVENVGGRLVLAPWRDASLSPDPTLNLSRTAP